MKEKTLLCDRYLWERFGETCRADSKRRIGCTGVALWEPDNYHWDDVVLGVARKCGKCPLAAERCGFYRGNVDYSEGFEDQAYVKLDHIQSQAEFEAVCARLSPDLRGCICAVACPMQRHSGAFKNWNLFIWRGKGCRTFGICPGTPICAILWSM